MVHHTYTRAYGKNFCCLVMMSWQTRIGWKDSRILGEVEWDGKGRQKQQQQMEMPDECYNVNIQASTLLYPYAQLR